MRKLYRVLVLGMLSGCVQQPPVPCPPAPAPAPVVNPTPVPAPVPPSPVVGPPAPNPVPAPLDVFTTWCALAVQTKAIQNFGNADFATFCQNGAPTTLLTTQLVNNAYMSAGTPDLIFVKPVSSSGNTTSAVFGVGIKLPDSSVNYFNNIAPLVATQAHAQALAVSAGSTLTKFEVLQTFNNDGPFQVRGWLLHTVTSEKAFFLTINSEDTVRFDQHELIQGQLYLYTQVIQQGQQIFKDYRVISAGIQVGGSNYLLTLTRVSVDNKGFAKQAEQKLQQIADAIVQTTYNEATGQ